MKRWYQIISPDPETDGWYTCRLQLTRQEVQDWQAKGYTVVRSLPVNRPVPQPEEPIIPEWNDEWWRE